MTGKPNIHFFFQKPANIPEKARLKTFIAGLLKKEKRKLNSLNCIFCSDKYLLEINQEYLGHDEYTDIITFNLSDTPQVIEGEVYISVDRVKENASKLKLSFRNELLRVIFHGVLHLCNYNDKTPHERAKMRKKEDKCLKEFHVKR
jgi:probable rRNA maturation factor